MYIRETSLSFRVKNVLNNYNIFTVDELLSSDSSSFESMRNLGVKSIAEIHDFIEEHSGEVKSDREVLKIPNDFIRDGHRTINELINYNSEETKEILFIDGYNMSKELSTEGFSVRTKNILEKYKLNNVDVLITYSYKEIRSLPNLGAKSSRELLENLFENIIIISNGKEIANFDSLLAYKIVKDFERFISYESSRSIYNEIKTIVKEVKAEKKYTIEDISKNFKEVVNNIDFEKLYRTEILESIIEKLLKDSSHPMNTVAIKNSLPMVFKELELSEPLNNLKIKDKINLTSEGIRYKKPSILNVISRLNNQRFSRILSLRLEGLTLEQIASEFEFTRERARQIQSKALSKITEEVFEDRYKESFEKYGGNKSEFISAFLIEEVEYNYLRLLYTPGQKDLEEMLTDDEIEISVRKRLKSILDKGYIIIDENRIKENKTDIIRYLSKTNAKDVLTKDEFMKLYKTFLNNHNLELDKLQVDQRYLDNRIDDLSFFITQPGRKFRFYKYEDYDWEVFYQEIDINKFDGLEISAAKIFNENKLLMKIYDIRNEYELHNVMKRTRVHIDIEIEFIRNPTIRIGKTDRNQQVKSLFLTHSPIKSCDFGKIYEEEYGVKSVTAQATDFKCISNYLYNGEYIYENVELSDDELLILNSLLSKEALYYIEDIKSYLLNEGILKERILEIITPHVMRGLNYNVFTSYVLHTSYDSMTEYVERIFENQDIVDLNKIDTRLLNISVAWSRVREYQEKLEFIEFDRRTYISIERLEESGIAREYLSEKVECIYNDMNEEIISLEKIKNYFDDSKVNELGFSNVFFISLLKSHDDIYCQRQGGGYLVRKNNSNLRLVDLIVQIMQEEIIIEIYDLIDTLIDEYKIQIDKSKIVASIKDTDLYYDEIMEKVYSDESYYYEEFDN